jgi:hypothetical protein
MEGLGSVSGTRVVILGNQVQSHCTLLSGDYISGDKAVPGGLMLILIYSFHIK